MERKVLSFIQEHELVEKGKTVLVGVSGGPDSMALLHFFQQIRKKWNLRIKVVIVDHQLRAEESKEEVFYVQNYCKEWDIPLKALSVDVNTYKHTHKLSTQVAARQLRYQVYEEQMHHLQADYLALGHHGDDQIETLIMSTTRTTNLSSLTGIPLRRNFAGGQIIRPLLCVTKKEIEQYCHQHNIQPRIDSTNLDTYYTRNAIRKYVVPMLKKQNENLHTTMQRLSESLQEDEDYLVTEAKKMVEQTVSFNQKGKKAIFIASNFKKYPVSLQRRAYRLILDCLYDKLPEKLSYMHEEIFFSLLRKPSNKVVHFPRQLLIERSYENILFYFRKDKQKKYTYHQEITKIPSCIDLPNGAILSITSTSAPLDMNAANKYTYVCPESQISFPIHIRTRIDGDRMRYKGLQGSKKIKDILIDEKIPRKERDNIYVLADNEGEILWLIGIRKNERSNTRESGPYILFMYKEGTANFPKEEKDGKRY